MHGIVRTAGISLLSLTLMAGAAQAADGFYLSPGVGVVVPMKTDFDVQGVAGTIDYKAGLTGTIAGGYRMDNFRFEIEGGYSSFGIDTVRTVAGVSGRLQGDFEMWSGFASAYVDLPLGDFKPYVGAGVGIVRTDGSDILLDASEGLRFPANSNLGIHGEVGVLVQAWPNVTFAPNYRYLHVRNGHDGIDHLTAHRFQISAHITF